jgi:pSer/pThr/pTyr-binding forkhead associated (FHA) protein
MQAKNMPQVPNISVQLIHIQGPLKGQIQDFSQFPVKIGRHSSCQVRFDKDLTTISRRHARIERHGNRFRIIDASTNGTYVNGKRIADVYLRDGDVITFSDNGPKASFLTNIETAEAPVQSIPSRVGPHAGIVNTRSSFTGSAADGCLWSCFSTDPTVFPSVQRPAPCGRTRIDRGP